jgi:hypothetical protein
MFPREPGTASNAGFTENVEVLHIEPEIEEPSTPPKMAPNSPTTPMSIRTPTLDLSFSVHSIHGDTPVFQSFIKEANDGLTHNKEIDDEALGV